MAEKLLGSAIQSGTITTTQLSGALSSTISQGGGPKILSLTYPGDDTAANSVGGQTVVVNGTGFQTNVQIYVNGNAVPSVTYTNANSVSFTTPALNAATYPLYLTNTDDGGTAILIPGLQISGEPTWSTSATLPEQDADTAWNISLSATSDSNVSYSLASGSSLPAGISLAANGLISGTMSSPPNDDTTYNFTVVATDAENQDASRAFSVNVTVGEGVAFANTVLLLHADGTNNQNNHTFLDSSNNNFTITRNGNATQGSFSPFSQTGWSNYFGTTSDYLNVPISSFPNSTTTWTIEGWFYPGSTSGGAGFFCSPDLLNIYYNGTTFVVEYRNNPSSPTWSVINGTISMSPNIWYHIAISTNAGSMRLFINGTQYGSTVSVAAGAYGGTGSNVIQIGTGDIYPFGSVNYTINGFVSNFRISNTALYTSNFTPSTSPITATANTTLLTCQSNRFVDNSNNNVTITRNGDVRIVPYSPFAATSKYTTANVGGSGYFDGTDALVINYNSALHLDGDFTIEFWHYAKEAGVIINFAGTENVAWASYRIAIADGYFQFAASSSNAGYNIGSQTGTDGRIGAAVYDTWSHVVVTRSGNTYRGFLNGILGFTQTISQTPYNPNARGLSIGSTFINTWNSTPYDTISGYISNLRIIKGTALYTENFTVPTAPLTNIANTSLLLNFTNAGIFDSTAKHVIETIGDAKVSTSVVKYGTGSMYFDGTGDYLKLPNSPTLGFGSGDYTVECWVNAPSYSSSYMALFDNRSPGQGIAFYAGGTSTDASKLILANNTAIVFTSVTTLTPNVWTHVACVRSNSNVTLYINGTAAGANTSANTLDNRVLASNAIAVIGGTTGDIQLFNGYIDDLRISRFARYTSNFTPPTAAFKDR